MKYIRTGCIIAKIDCIISFRLYRISLYHLKEFNDAKEAFENGLKLESKFIIINKASDYQQQEDITGIIVTSVCVWTLSYIIAAITSNFMQTTVENIHYNIAFVNSERWLAKSRVDITLCQHGKFPATLLLKFFVLYYKRNIKHFFCIDIQLYQHSWKLEKLEIVWKHSALRASCFHTISRFSNFHSCWYNSISTRKMFYIS